MLRPYGGSIFKALAALFPDIELEEDRLLQGKLLCFVSFVNSS